jgi:cytosine/adenosine deaminase-related metal-dependent hydrolase
LRAGVRIALGTDSLASNDDLDMAREMALLRTAHRDLSPERVWDMATRAGARALGHSTQAGTLAPGSRADAVAWSVPARSRRAALEALTSGSGAVGRVWIDGEQVWGRDAR